jgi:hypothetical protein
MYDAVTPTNIVRNAPMVAGYIDGDFEWSPADWALFPNSTKVRIATSAATNDGDVLDVERFDAFPEQAAGWVAMRRKATGKQKTVYCSLSTWPVVKADFIPGNSPLWWIAAYPGIGQALYQGTVAHQYADPGPVDISVVDNYWDGIDPAGSQNIPSQPLPLPYSPLQEATMLAKFIHCKDNRIACIGPKVTILTPAEWQVFVNSGETIDPHYANMDPGPFNAVIAALGGTT